MNSLSDNQVSIYEEPVQEKVRKFLKIEYLFDKIYYFKSICNTLSYCITFFDTWDNDSEQLLVYCKPLI